MLNRSSCLHSQLFLTTKPYDHLTFILLYVPLSGLGKVELGSKPNCTDLNGALRNVRHSLPSPTLNTHTP